MLLSQALDKVIDLAGQVRDYYDRELPRYHRDYPLVHPDEQEPPSPPVEQELADYLGSLPDETVYALATMTDFVRWNLRPEDLGARSVAKRAEFKQIDQVVGELVGYSPLADVLDDARDALRHQGIDVDGLFSQPSLV